MNANAGLHGTNPSGLAQSSSFLLVLSVYLFKQNLGSTRKNLIGFQFSPQAELFTWVVLLLDNA